MPTQKRPYERLVVWKEADDLCLEIYKIIQKFPADERYCLCNQMRRSAYSVPMNTVEGNMKRSKDAKLNFMEHAEGSLEELDYQLQLSFKLRYLTESECEEIRNRIRRVSYLLQQFRKGIMNR